MRTVLLGTDFMFKSDGSLVPIETNTNLGMDWYPVEASNDIFDLTQLTTFVNSNGFTKISYIGGLYRLYLKLQELCTLIGIEYEHFEVNGLTVPFVEDSDTHLIIRSAYDSTALVDDEYCKVKTNFLNLIKNQTFGSQFAYKDTDGNLVNNITNIPDNGNHPNFILKAVYPTYDKNVYPKLFKVANQSELDVVLQNVTSEYHLVEFHYNPTKLYQNHIQVFRSFNLLFPPNLNSITIGQNTKITTRNIDETSTFDNTTFELSNTDRTKYITAEGGISQPKLLDTDKVEMADGTFKTALELENGDVVKTIIMPNPNNVSLENNLADFAIDYQTFVDGVVYTSNKILNKTRVDKVVDYVTITFTDNTIWEDTNNSNYLILRNNNVRFVNLHISESPNSIQVGDNIILINTANSELTAVLKEVQSVVMSRQIFSGWEITVEENHIFLTQTSDNTSFAAIEHNVTCTAPATSCSTQAECGKGQYCCPQTDGSDAGKCSGTRGVTCAICNP